MSLPSAEGPSAREGVPSIDGRLLSGPNPFDVDKVRSPWEPDASADVPGIHAAVSEAILGMAEQVRSDGRTRAALIIGQPGAGKTHLLRRIRGQLRPPALFVYVHPFADARSVHRYILRQFITSLDQPAAPGGPSQIELLVDALRGRERELVRTMPGVLPDVVTALGCLAQPARWRRARQWLEGCELDPEDLRELQVASTLAEENEAFEALVTLGKVTRTLGPVVLCFDQLEFLPSAGDLPGFATLGGTLANLFNAADNLVILISCLERTWIESASQWPESARDRLGSCRFDLEPLTPEQALLLCHSRLLPLYGDDAPPWPAYPFLPEFFQVSGLHHHVTPRRLLNLCRDALDGCRKAGQIRPIGLPVPEPPRRGRPADEIPGATEGEEGGGPGGWLTAELKRRIEARRQRASVSPPEDGLVVRALAALLDAYRVGGTPLGDLQVAEVQERRGKDPAVAVELARGGQRQRALVACINTQNGRSFVARMDRVLRELRGGGCDAALVVRSAGVPLKDGWVKGRERVEQLRELGGELLYLDRQSESCLEGILDLLADASAGDLAWRGRTLWLPEAQGWLGRSPPAEAKAALGPVADALQQVLARRRPAGPEATSGAAQPSPVALGQALCAIVEQQRVLLLDGLPALLRDAGVPADMERVLEAIRANSSTIVLCSTLVDRPLVARRPRPRSGESGVGS